MKPYDYPWLRMQVGQRQMCLTNLDKFARPLRHAKSAEHCATCLSLKDHMTITVTWLSHIITWLSHASMLRVWSCHPSIRSFWPVGLKLSMNLQTARIVYIEDIGLEQAMRQRYCKLALILQSCSGSRTPSANYVVWHGLTMFDWNYFHLNSAHVYIII